MTASETSRPAHEASLLSRVASLTGSGGWELELATRRVTLTREVFALYEVDPGTFELTLENLRAPFDDSTRARIDAAARRAIIEGAEWDLELPLLTARGRSRWVRTRGRPIRAGGRSIALVGTLEDITEARAARTRLAQLTEQLRLVADLAGLGIFTRDLKSGIGEWNNQMFLLYGFDATRSTPTRDELLAHIHRDDRERFLREWFDADVRATQRAAEFRVLRVDGVAHIYTHGVVERGVDGEPARLLGVAMDVTRLRRAESEMRAAHERLSLATGSAGLGVFVRDLASGKSYWDPAVFRMFGLPETEHAPDRAAILAAVHPDDRKRYLADWRTVRDSSEILVTEIRTVHQDGSMRWVQIRGRGEGDRVAGVAIDVTEQKQAEEQARIAQRELQSTLKRLELAASGSALGIFERELDRDRAYWSREQFALWGEPEAAQPPDWRRLLSLVHADDRAMFEAQWQKLIRSTEFVQSEFRIVPRDGSERWLMTRGKTDSGHNGHERRVVGITLDITRIRAAQRERDSLIERFDLIGRSMGLGLWDYDPVKHESIWNDQMYALYGVDRGRFSPRHWIDLIHRDDVVAAERSWKEALAQRATFDQEFRAVRPDGTVRWIASRGRIARDKNGIAQRAFGIDWDITEQKDAHAALAAKDAAERASAAKSEFLSRMSHELRTPLNAILGFAQILQIEGGEPLSRTQRGHIGQIVTAGWHLLTLINEVLDLSRVETGGAHIDLQAIELGPVIDECLSLTVPDAQRRSISIARDDAPTAPRQVWADSTRLKQTLLNLLSNAVKYNRDGGEVTVRVAAGGGRRVRICVSDTGRGINAQQVKSLFQPFNRLGLETSKIEGTGIGLTISKKLVELMHGTLSVTSEEGRGSEFTVELDTPGDQTRA